MQVSDHHPFDQLMREHRALLCDYGQVQVRCSALLHAQAREIERLQAQVMRLRAGVILRETALAWAREDHAALERQTLAGLPMRLALARRVDALRARIQELVRERPSPGPRAAVPDEAAAPAAVPAVLRPPEPDALEASLRAADLVICQTGCLSHGAFWRVQDHCKRTGKACVLVAQPEALRIVRIHGAPDGEGGARVATLQAQPAP